MITPRLFFILVIIQSSLVLSMKLLQDSSDKHVKEKHDLSHRLLKRQVQCIDGEYHAGKLCCKVCHKGTRAASDCTVAHGQPVCEACTKGVDFMDKENGYPKCQGCRNCESGSGQEELHQCTIIQNTVCKCKKEFYCSESLSSADQHCNRCQRCTLCEDGVAEECTSTNDTVCKNSSNRNYVIAAVLGVIGVIGIIAIVFVVLKFCRKPRETELPDSVPFIPKPTCPPELENIKLENHLLEISGLMVLQSVKLVTRHLTPVQLEEIKMNTQHNAREEKFELLKTWYYDHGSQGAFKMLIENCTNVEAEKILDLVQERNAEP